MRFLVPLLCCVIIPVLPSGAADVSVNENDQSFRISNGKLAATIEKHSARVISVALEGRELLGAGSGYWSMAATSAGSRVQGFGKSEAQFVSIDPASNGGERAEISCRFQGKGTDAAYPGTTEIRYAIDRNSTTLYATAIIGHGVGDAAFRMEEGRFVIKLDSAIFDHLTVDHDRNRVTPTGIDWDAGTPLNLKEAKRMTTGTHAGWAEHKYSYSAILENVPAYGWLGTKEPVGVWMINPSVEYIAGGPTKMELTGHVDVGGTSLPTLLNMWHGSHYGGTVLNLAKDEKWSKVIGPFAIHFNQGGDPDDRWKSALQHAAAERAAWPYSWVRHENYLPPSERGNLSGSIRISESRAVPTAPQTLWVGLTAPSYQSGPTTVDWQQDSRNYQYWIKAGPDGGFSLSGVRPGNYVLRAFVDGITGEYEQADVVVEAGKTRSLGELLWKPERAGPTLWEIGIPDRSAAEFRNGDQYWHWGNYLKFKSDFPDGVNFLVGKSDWKKDWHVCQPLDLSPTCEVLGNSAWTVRFPLEKIPAGGTLLRISFCGSRTGAVLALLLNGTEIGNTGPLPENGAMHRDSHRGYSFVRTFAIPPSRLNPGENVLQFRLDGKAWHQGVLYDHLRMEEVTAPPAVTPEVSGEIDSPPGAVSGNG